MCMCHLAQACHAASPTLMKPNSNNISNNVTETGRTLHMKLVEGGPKLAIITFVSGFIVHTAAGLGSAMLYW
jgi:hypothetical protein